MPRRDYSKSKAKKISASSSDSKDSKTLSILDKVFESIPDMVDSIMIKIDESREEESMECNQVKLEKEVATIKSDVESTKYDVMDIVRQLPPRERRPPSLGDALGNLFSGISDEGISFQNVPYSKKTSTCHTIPNAKWNTTISKIEEAFSDEDDISEYSDISD